MKRLVAIHRRWSGCFSSSEGDVGSTSESDEPDRRTVLDSITEAEEFFGKSRADVAVKRLIVNPVDDDSMRAVKQANWDFELLRINNLEADYHTVKRFAEANGCRALYLNPNGNCGYQAMAAVVNVVSGRDEMTPETLKTILLTEVSRMSDAELESWGVTPTECAKLFGKGAWAGGIVLGIFTHLTLCRLEFVTDLTTPIRQPTSPRHFFVVCFNDHFHLLLSPGQCEHGIYVDVMKLHADFGDITIPPHLAARTAPSTTGATALSASSSTESSSSSSAATHGDSPVANVLSTIGSDDRVVDLDAGRSGDDDDAISVISLASARSDVDDDDGSDIHDSGLSVTTLLARAVKDKMASVGATPNARKTPATKSRSPYELRHAGDAGRRTATSAGNQ